jgi:hypothetical protein
MNKFRTIAVALTAILTVSSLGVSTASAADLDSINSDVLADVATPEEKFVSSFTNTEEIKIADYLIDSGVDLEDAELAMQIYEEGVSATSTSTPEDCGLDFYSTDDISPTRHTLAIVDLSPSTAKNDSILAEVNTDIITSDIEFSLNSVYENSNIYSTCKFIYDDEFVTFRLVGKSVNVSSPRLIASSALTFDADAVNNENDLREAFDADFGKSSGSVEVQTYSVGDVWRDGKVSATDSSTILKYIVGSTDLNYTYNDGETHGSSVVNKLAADVNHDGSINDADVLLLNKYIVGSATLN